MPELPDLEVFATNLNKIFAGKKVKELKVINGKKLKDTAKELSVNIGGKTLKQLYRSGKEMRFLFTDKTLLGLHLMLTGDILVFDKINEHKFTIVKMYFTNGKGLALTDRMRNANVKLNREIKKAPMSLPAFSQIQKGNILAGNFWLQCLELNSFGNFELCNH